jgi:hypothetical protein
MSKPRFPLLTLTLIGLVVLALAVVVVSQSTGGLFAQVNSVGRASASVLDAISNAQIAALRGPDLLLGDIPQQVYLPLITR